MRRLSYELVERAFTPYGPNAVRWSLCVVNRESGGNPGAISRTDDHGLPQFNRPSHPWIDYTRLKRDPPYAVAIFVRMSRGGSYRSPWSGGHYSC
jgi:hypothetical protein